VKKTVICVLLSLLVLCTIVIPVAALENGVDDQLGINDAELQLQDFSFEITIPPEGDKPIYKEFYVYENGVTKDGRVIMNVTDKKDNNLQYAALWIVFMDPTSYPRTYKPSVYIVQDGLDSINYAEAKLNFGDGTSSWKSYSGDYYAGHLLLEYPQKQYHAPGTYTVKIDSASAHFKVAGWKYFPRDFSDLPITLRVQ